MKADIEEFFAERFKVFFENKTGQNLTNYNMAFLKSKIKEKLKDQNISSFREFFEKMIINQHIDSELDDLFYIIINRESDFFRYSDQFVYFRDHVLPELYHTCQKENRCLIKILCIGIALGQEPYSIAMILEDMKDMYPGLMISIEANEMVQKNIDFARDGVYDPNLLRYFNRYDDYLFKEFFDKYFIPVNGKDGSYEINNAIRQRVNYRKMNVIFDDLSDEYDIIFCR
ncbi:MAG: hypothetical protein KKH98_07775, partial [Spirochaetes bacterium]|nr:hypothetical protein [Spirochaetota bacterium]